MEKQLVNYILTLMIIATTFGQELDQTKLANEYYLSKEYVKAAQIYKKLSKQKKNIQRIHTNYFDLMITSEKFDDAAKYISHVVRVLPNQTRYRVDQIYMAGLLQNKSDNKRLNDDLFQDYKNNPIALKRISEELSQRKLHREGLFFLSQARTISNDPTIYALDFAKIYKTIGNDNKMLGEYLKFAAQQPRHVPYIKSILQELLSEDKIKMILEEQLITSAQRNPDELLYNDLLMWLYIQQNDYYGAFVQAKAIDRSRNSLGKTVMQVAKVAHDNQAYSDAISFYGYVVTKSDQRNIREKAQFLSLLSQEKDLTHEVPVDAEVADQLTDAYQWFYDHAAEKNTDRYTALKNKSGLLAYYLDQPDTALSILEDLVTLPGLRRTFIAQVKMDLGNVHLIVGNHWEASLLYSQVEKENAYAAIGYEAKLKNARLHYFMSNFDLAKAHLDILKRSTTKEIANDALELSLFIETNTLGDSNQLGLTDYARVSLLMYQNRFEEAHDKLEILINTQLGHPILDDCFWLLAKLEMRLGRYEEALDPINILISEYSEGVLGDDALFMKAQILEEHLDNALEAQKVYQQFLGEFPGSAYAVEARRRFRLLRGDSIN